MKEPATRVVYTSRYTPQMARKRRRAPWLRRLIVLLTIMVGGWWVVRQVSAPGGHTVAGVLRRVLGDQTTAGLEAAYRDILGQSSARVVHYPTPIGGSVPAPSGGTGQVAAITVRATPVAIAVRATPVPGDATRRSPLSPAGGAARSATARAVKPVVAARVPAPPRPPMLKPIPAAKLLQNDYQIFETWNNCGPASLSMALSYFGIYKSQQELGDILRPFQNPYGDNDDKDVTMEALAGEARKLGLLAYYRPNGNMTLLKRFVAIGLPVIAETVLTKGDDIGHYRVVKGYDNNVGVITQDDSMQGHNVQFSYADFDYMWKKYNYEYLVLAPKSMKSIVEEILGKNLNPKTAWEETVAMDRAALAVNPSDVDSRFNLSVALYYVGAYAESVHQFELVQNQLPFRTLWYQIEPIEAYYALGAYQTVFSLTDQILNDGNRAFSQLYILRGKIDLKEGNVQAARAEFEKAVFYNKNLKAAQDALRSVS